MELLVDLASENTCLDSSTVGDSFIRVDASVWLLAIEELLDQRLNFRDSGGAAYEHDLIDLAALQPRVLHDLLDRLQGVLEEVLVELLELSPGERLLEIDSIDEIVNENSDLGL